MSLHAQTSLAPEPVTPEAGADAAEPQVDPGHLLPVPVREPFSPANQTSSGAEPQIA